jgi:ubiquinone/menaquinone biosynthesis C-methylase UbiE
MKIDNSFERYFGKENDPNYKRYAYSVSHLFGKVLDVGCGDGFGAYLMTKNNLITKITGIDINKEAVMKAESNVDYHKALFYIMDASYMKYDDYTFDSVHCGQTLEHVKDDEQVIKEIARVVRRRAVFSVPICGGISEQHVREYRNAAQVYELIGQYFRMVSSRSFIDQKRQERLVIIAER